MNARPMRNTMVTARKGGTGFTLIELMIVLVVIAVLAGIAYPSYVTFVTRSDRSDAREALAAVQMAQERRRAQATALTAGYTGNLGDLGLTSESPRGLYTIAITSASRGGFTATATAQGRQQRDASVCQTMTLEVTPAGERRTPAQCW